MNILSDLFIFFFLANSCFQVLCQPAQPTSRITVLGSVYCDVCHDNAFSKHGYFLPGVDIHVECRFKASAARTAEQIYLSVNRTTDRYGTYKLDIPSVSGVDCTEDPTIQSFCQASLILTRRKTTSNLVTGCNVPSSRSTLTEITIKSKQNNACTYTLGALSYKPPSRNASLCGDANQRLTDQWRNSLNSSKYFLFPWPPNFPQLPPLPQFPPLPPLPQLPPLPPLPQFPPLPQLPPFPFFPPPSPAFGFGVPNIPLLSPPVPLPPPAPVFNFWDPRTWIPHYPPSPPSNPTTHHP